MYQYSYNDILADSPIDARAQERDVFDHAIRLLRQAAGGDPRGPEEREALSFVNQLWGVIIRDLSSSENDLPAALRAQLMSVGLWVMAEAQRIEVGESRGFDAMIEVCLLVRGGLD